jgi:hypothetical protein
VTEPARIIHRPTIDRLSIVSGFRAGILFKLDVTQIDGHKNWLRDLLKIIPIAEDTPPSW